MHKISKFFQRFMSPMSRRDRYLSEATDMIDLEMRQRDWDKIQFARSSFHMNNNF